jgi:hypothetical protein
VRGFDFAVDFVILLFLFQGSDLRFRQNKASLGDFGFQRFQAIYL